MTISNSVEPSPRSEFHTMLRAFAAHDVFRSATVEELECPGKTYRRPLRPEDLEFLEFRVAICPETICDLPSLAAQRLLRCLLDVRASPESFESFDIAAVDRLINFFEGFALGFLEQVADVGSVEAPPPIFFDAVAARYGENKHAFNICRFLVVQQHCIDLTLHEVIGECAFIDGFHFLDQEERPDRWFDCGSSRGRYSLTELGLDSGSDTYWQFYLPTSLARANHADLLGRGSVPALLGVAFVIEAEGRALAHLVEALTAPGVERARIAEFEILRKQVEAKVRHCFGDSGFAQFERGKKEAELLVRLAEQDRGRQIEWLTALDEYAAVARVLNAQISTGKIEIDRETFVEPREMCSTTHVHNEHRLIAIESGDMTFWGWPGMRHAMGEGDILLVPRGRLHGSAVTSATCTYHQPIIPPAWIESHGWDALT